MKLNIRISFQYLLKLLSFFFFFLYKTMIFYMKYSFSANIRYTEMKYAID